MSGTLDLISPDVAPTLPALFCERVRRTPDACAYRRFDLGDRCCEEATWAEVSRLAARWQVALRQEGLQPGDRVAVMLRNSLEWVIFDLASMGLGLITVPLFVNDRPDNFTFILGETGAKFLLLDGVEQWERIRRVQDRLVSLVRFVAVIHACDHDCDPRLIDLSRWIPEEAPPYDPGNWSPDSVASIVYTSGTTGNPKGVMLTHRNMLSNAWAGMQRIPIYREDLFLSFLPLSHTLERTAGYYAPMMAGASVAHVRSLEKLPEDLVIVRPTVIVSVPRVFERVHKRLTGKLAQGPRFRRELFFLAARIGWQRFQHRQGTGGWSPSFLLWPILKHLVADKVMAALGGRVRLSISGGAPLNPETARLFISFGLDVLQGYGLTETSPVVAVNPAIGNRPETVGPPIDGVQVKVAGSGELLVKGPNVMSGYWNRLEATQLALEEDGWLHTGDLATVDGDGYISITGRIKDIIVLATGEKVAPADLEMAIAVDPLFEQVLVVGEGRPYLSALVVVNEEQFLRVLSEKGLAEAREAVPADDPRVEQTFLERIAAAIAHFPGYAKIWRVHATLIPWEINEGLITATLKLRRAQLIERYRAEIDALYAGH
ncbi:AMP-dependent synthetase/ligase [Geomesophilobacter sediminis]|uniref:Long-chain fatty acid--CoA ligase n=1 Tax=Geomesophilobacter sediminis TaxID=2798584 RepID=A0A8J7J3H0_9BACT|nr:long-chain fatty acid--CoA ligase [Geomesophilobacter sediminis]MBJ6725323.1 long-chain fatty acid--CoA ligase [Geomesophilobacter sediminis]